MSKKSFEEISSRDSQWRKELRDALKAPERTAIPRARMNELDPAFRITCNEEVNQGLEHNQAVREATRCLDCPNPGCVTGCPVNINIPAFVKNIQRGDTDSAGRILRATSALPSVCGRVCPQERQCESKCIYLKMGKQPVAIGWLERFAADNSQVETNSQPEPNGKKVCVVGSGPASLSFAGSMSALGYKIVVYEALHQIGGVLKYGIPEFRLPNEIVDKEINRLRDNGVEFHTDIVVGKTLGYSDLLKEGFDGIFIASGAGLPRFMDIPGENLNGVMSSNEFLTRVNLMGAGRHGYATPVRKGHVVAVIGGGNTAMDSVRTALRQGAERAMIVYRRDMAEMPARAEEVEHARQEGVEFMTLHNPVEYIGNERGEVCAMRLQQMRLGEPGPDGRRSPEPIPGAIVEIPVDEVIVSVGVSPNPLIPNSIEGLEVTRRGTLVVDDNLRTSIPTMYAGGDIVRGGATVILAMGDGRQAAAAMDAQLSE